MKFYRLSFSIALLFFSFSSLVFGQRTITLHVNTDNITASQPEEYCFFEEPGDAKDFLATVPLGEIIVWEGQSTNGSDTVFIHRIIRIGGPNVFNAELVEAIGSDRNVKAIVRNRTEIDNNGNFIDYRYLVQFSINSKTSQVYTLDPLIRTDNRDVIPPRR